ncbi:two-component system, chemotaxis family, response regulator CheB [Chitinophaga rupis]|uniref:protein-glutamate methylesterase n=1 Tax=Chitinophaga rupis TaxID=573321 RepID=A0A1H7R045_9BACT|nr:chemotaxis protein CheB [Chitinophaga rupis]SEL53358.1 two-component system, chemotaxis family, response regulator CheB [Chitinophaga rupis]
MSNRNIIVIGASAGGFQAIKRLVASLPADLNAAIFIVWHMAPNIQGLLPLNLNKLGTLPASNAIDMEPVETRRIYVARPDFHLMLEKGVVRVTRGPKENRFRPAVDPLFRSAAFAYREKVIGVVLSGALDDGAAGLWTIKQYGGLAVVQDPADAEVSSMPESALRAVKADYVVPIKEMGKLLTELVKEQVTVNGTAIQDKTTELEINIALDEESLKHNIMEYGNLTPYTCPECHGVLTVLNEDGRLRFRCHTGHAFSASSLLAAISERIEESLWSAVRNVQESAMLLNHMGDHFAELNQPRLAATFFQKAKDAEQRAEIVRRTVEDHEQLSIDSIEQQSNNEHPS